MKIRHAFAAACIAIAASAPAHALNIVIGNDDGMGGKTTLECIYTNNDVTAAPIQCK